MEGPKGGVVAGVQRGRLLPHGPLGLPPVRALADADVRKARGGKPGTEADLPYPGGYPLVLRIDVLTVYLSEWRQLATESLATNRTQRERYAALFHQILRDGVAAGEFRPMDTRIVMLGMIGMCNYLFRWYRPEGRLTPDEVADSLIDMVMRGVSS